MASGPKFAATVTETGFMMLGLGAVVLVALVVPILILGLFVFKMPYDEVAGIVAGACGNPAILAYCEQTNAHGSPGHRIRNDLSRYDDREDPLRGHCPGAFLAPESEVSPSDKDLSLSSGLGILAAFQPPAQRFHVLMMQRLMIMVAIRCPCGAPL
jgi:hypothetical protein